MEEKIENILLQVYKGQITISDGNKQIRTLFGLKIKPLKYCECSIGCSEINIGDNPFCRLRAKNK